MTEFFTSAAAKDPFNEDVEVENTHLVAINHIAEGLVHLRIQQRNARQRICTVEGLSPHLDFKKIKKVLMKKFCCNGIVVNDPELGQILQFQGDHRKSIAQFIIEEGLVSSPDMVKIHG